MIRWLFLVAGLLAILRSGRPYVPLVRSLPAGRVRQIVETLSVLCVLTQAAFAAETGADRGCGARSAIRIALITIAAPT